MSKLNPISEERKQERKNEIIKTLKSMIFPIVLFAIIGAGIIFIMTYQKANEEEEPIPPYAYDGDGKEVVIENDKLKLVMDSTTTNFTLTVKSSGKVWHSVPDGAANDTLAINETKNRLQSSFLLKYSNDGGLDTILDSYSFSALNGIYTIAATDDTITIDYSLGKVAKEFIIPPVMLADKFDNYLAQMSNQDKDKCKQFYKLYDINNLKKNDNKEELLEFYPILETEKIYVLRADKMKDTAKKSLQAIFESVGYTYEEYLDDKELNQKEAVNENPVFNAQVIYKLEGDDLVVEVPTGSLEGQPSFPITGVSPLPYFGAAGKDEEGFLLVPEGGGSIMNFNNGKTSQNIYVANMYGPDLALERTELVHSTQAHMNVFGISDLKDSFICILEEGASYAAVTADVAGRDANYNYVNALFTMKEREKYDLGASANTEMYIYLEEIPKDESVKMRYSFINSGSYVDMAKDYQKYLLNKYSDVMTKGNSDSIPLVIETVGAVDKVRQIVGIPVSRPLALTTYAEAAELITDLKNEGVNNLSIKYTGWMNGGVRQKYLDNVKLIASLGNKKDLQNLSNTASNLGVDLYLDGICQYAFKSNIFNGFFSYTDAAKFLSRKRAELYEYSHVTYQARDGLDGYFLLHPDRIQMTADTLLKETQKYSTNVSFQDIGTEVSADYYRKNPFSREKAVDQHASILKAAKDAGQKVMINAGNAYAAPYADVITRMDLTGSEYTILDYAVPFYQIALHGYVDYTGYPINTCGDEVEELLNCVEYGAGLDFSIMKETPFTLQHTLYTEYYASEYDSWHDHMMEIYNRYNNELGHTFNQQITDHKRVTNDISCTVYEDGTKVYVNYGFKDEVADGVKVPARDYLVVK